MNASTSRVALSNHLENLAQSVKNYVEDFCMQAVSPTFQDISYDNGVLSFLNANGDVVKNFNLPQEIYLRSVGTTFVPNFSWNNVAYPNSTNPNLEGKPVLVLNVMGDDLNNPYDNYFFVNMEDLIKLYLPADQSISITGNSVAVNISSLSSNVLTLANDGLLVDLDNSQGGSIDGYVAILTSIFGN